MKTTQLLNYLTRLSTRNPPTLLVRRRLTTIQNHTIKPRSPLTNNLSRRASPKSPHHSYPSRPFSSQKSPPYDPTPHLTSPSPSLSFSQRLRKLSREYGWSALGVYIALSALDFPFCFIAVRSLGTDRIGRWEGIVLEWVWSVVPYPFPERESGGAVEGGKNGEEFAVVGEGEGVAVPGVGGLGHGIREAEEENRSENASIWTQLALAYAIHKSFIFIRVPVTAAVTPKVVKVLRGWGWDIGKRKPKG
ncbi:hypothetical protein MMC12_005791 [Toensbergia leucococca]|nr:hypothetical protein [Toensbergia leucococca]